MSIAVIPVIAFPPGGVEGMAAMPGGPGRRDVSDSRMNSIDCPCPTATSPKAEEILGSVRGVFARKGFEGASMQELAQAARMSVGNFYRYFPSKDAIITALVDMDMRQAQAMFAAARHAPDPAAAFRQLARQRACCITPEEAALWCEIEASAFRNPEIAGICQRIETAVRDNIMESLRLIAPAEAPVDERAIAVRAEFIILLIKGLAKKRGLAKLRGESGEIAGLSDHVVGVIDALISSAQTGAPPQLAAARSEG